MIEMSSVHVMSLPKEPESVQMRVVSGRSGMMQRQRPQQGAGPLSPIGVQRLGSTISTRSIKAIDVCVFLKNGTGHEFFLENALVETAEDLTNRMLEYLRLPEMAKDIFVLWIMSPLLQLQLKSHHIPFKLCRKWHDLLDKFTTATDEQKANDEPMLCFQRNAFFPTCKESQITDPKILCLLFDEAKCNILEGHYPCEADDFEYLAGILAFLEHGKYNPEDHPTGILKSAKPSPDNASTSSQNNSNQIPNKDFDAVRPDGKRLLIKIILGTCLVESSWSEDPLQRYVPPCMCKGGSRWIKNKGFATMEQRIVGHWDHVTEKVRTKAAAYKLFLEFCWKLPFYGCVFFSGQIERQSSAVSLRDTKDRPVHIGINREAVFLIDIAKQELILGLTFDELSWEYTEPTEGRADCLPCLWLEFDSHENGKKCSKVLQIFSKQAVMMNAMIEASVEELNKRDVEGRHRKKTVMDGLLSDSNNQENGMDTVDGHIFFTRVAMEASAPAFGILPVKEPKTAICNKMDRLCLATFSEKGDLISRKARSTRRPFSLTNFFRSSDQK